MSVRLQTIIKHLEHLAPLALAQPWDNTGLLVGDINANVNNVMTCLTVTSEVITAAIKQKVDLLITHHPFPFSAVKKFTTTTSDGRKLLELISNKIAVYSAHSAYDSTPNGINDLIAQGLGLTKVKPLVTKKIDDYNFCGRCGLLPQKISLKAFSQQVASFFAINYCKVTNNLQQKVQHVGIACGAGSDLIALAISNKCDVLLTGEASMHKVLYASENNMQMVLVGHFSSEHFAMSHLANNLQKKFSTLSVKPCPQEKNPLVMVQK